MNQSMMTFHLQLHRIQCFDVARAVAFQVVPRVSAHSTVVARLKRKEEKAAQEKRDQELARREAERLAVEEERSEARGQALRLQAMLANHDALVRAQPLSFSRKRGSGPAKGTTQGHRADHNHRQELSILEGGGRR